MDTQHTFKVVASFVKFATPLSGGLSANKLQLQLTFIFIHQGMSLWALHVVQ